MTHASQSTQSGAGRETGGSIVAALENLSARCHDSSAGYRQAARETKDGFLRREFEQLAEAREEMAQDIDDCLAELGGSPKMEGSTLGAAHRFYLDVKGRVGANSRSSIIREISRGESAFEEAYDEALRVRNVPSNARRILREQHRQVRRDRDRFLAMANGGAEATGRTAGLVSNVSVEMRRHPLLTTGIVVLAGLGLSMLVARLMDRGSHR